MRAVTRTVKGRLLLGVLVLLLIAGAALALRHYALCWTPSRVDYPTQGISVSSTTGQVYWQAVRRHNADFAYIRAEAGASWRDPAFAHNWAGAREAGLRYGAQHDFVLCDRAIDQATMFMATVPRDNAALPPVIRLAFDPHCAARPPRDAVLSELDTFLNLIEAHVGKPAVIRVSKDFDALYDIGGGINRTLWLEGNFFTPSYASRPWVMWTASDMRQLPGVEGSVEWDVVKP